MSEPFLGEIRAFPFGFAPKGWAQCNGQLLPINQNQALYSILGNVYGGNGTTAFALPDLRGRAAIHAGNGVTLGQSAGEEAHTLTVNEMPQHTHMASASNTDPSPNNRPANNVWGVSPSQMYAASANVQMSPNALSTSGRSRPHQNMQPYNVLNFCIAVEGIFPTRE